MILRILISFKDFKDFYDFNDFGDFKYVQDFKDFEDFKTVVEVSNRHDFIGWGFEEADEIIKVNISCNVSDETFTNFVECLSDALSTRVSEINDRSRDYDEKRKSDFEEIMGVIDQD